MTCDRFNQNEKKKVENIKTYIFGQALYYTSFVILIFQHRNSGWVRPSMNVTVSGLIQPVVATSFRVVIMVGSVVVHILCLTAHVGLAVGRHFEQ